MEVPSISAASTSAEAVRRPARRAEHDGECDLQCRGGEWAGGASATTSWNGSAFTGQTFLFTNTAQNPSQANTNIDPGRAQLHIYDDTESIGGQFPTGSVTAVFTNTSLSANLGSAKVTAPSGLTITGGTASNGGTVSVAGQVVTVQGGSAVAPGGSITLSLNVTTTPSCAGASAAAWSSALGYSGISLNGTPLAFQGSYPTTSINPVSCSLSFVPTPAPPDPPIPVPTGVAQAPATSA